MEQFTHIHSPAVIKGWKESLFLWEKRILASFFFLLPEMDIIIAADAWWDLHWKIKKYWVLKLRIFFALVDKLKWSVKHGERSSCKSILVFSLFLNEFLQFSYFCFTSLNKAYF